MFDEGLSERFRNRFTDGRHNVTVWLGQIMGSGRIVTQSPAELAEIYNQSAYLGTKAVIVDVIASTAPPDIKSQQENSASLACNSAMVDMFDQTLNTDNPFAKKNIIIEFMERARILGWKSELKLQHLKLAAAESVVQDYAPVLADGMALYRGCLENIIDKIDNHIATNSKRRYDCLSDFVEDIQAFPLTEEHFNAEVRHHSPP